MKKIALLMCLITVLVFTFTACEAHTHEFESEWSSDSDFHWHSCKAVDGCPEQDSKEAHDFEVVLDEEGKPYNKCKVCAYTNDKVNTAPEHEHVFEDELTSNDNYHWYACTVEGCYEMNSKAEHAFSNPEIDYEDSKMTITSKCVDCGHEKVDVQNVKTEVDDALAWDNAFKNFKLTNFTMDVNFVYANSKHVNHCIVTEESVYYCIPTSMEYYTVKNADGTCTTYVKQGDNAGSGAGSFTKSTDTSDTFLVNGQKETVIQVSFEENFSKFTYDEATGSYVCEDPILALCYDFSGTTSREMYCYNNVVKIVDGKISSISANYYFNESELQMEIKSFSYYNIGLSSVEIPQSVINGAISQN